MDNVNCNSSEPSLLSCRYDPNAGEDSHYEDAGVKCFQEPGTPNCTSGALRLVGGQNKYEGRVEVCVLGSWGTVSDDLWWMIDGNVACKQLGFAYAGTFIDNQFIKIIITIHFLPHLASTPFYNAHFGQGSGNIWLDNVHCTGFEQRLVDCMFDANSAEDSHSEDAGLRCHQKGCVHTTKNNLAIITLSLSLSLSLSLLHQMDAMMET